MSSVIRRSTASNSATFSFQNFFILIFYLVIARLERLALRRFEIGGIVVVLSPGLLIVITRKIIVKYSITLNSNKKFNINFKKNPLRRMMYHILLKHG